MSQPSRLLIAFAVAVLIPVAAHAQASITGVVRDTSGAVLPGVTVEAASPALIEKIRSVVTDGTGQYRIENLRPGTYAVTFTLAGFNAVKREGVELTGSFTATVNAELRVGALEETITVTGEAPTVDVQSATRQRVLDQGVIDSIPAMRQPHALAVLIPGVTIQGSQDVGGALGNAQFPRAVVHGSRSDDQRVTFNGISVHTVVASGNISPYAPNLGAVQEVVIDYAAVSAEMSGSGVRINMIPREGGNVFKGTVFGSFVNSGMQGTNFTQELRGRGLTTPDSIKKNWDINPGFGGPIRKDRLWFYGTVRHTGAYNNVAGMFYNKNANNPNVWTYVPDTSRPASNDSIWKDAQLRLTWQATPKNKIAATYDQQDHCFCLSTVSAIQAPEAARHWYFPLQRETEADWTAPLTDRLLLEAVAVSRYERFIMDRPRDLNPLMIHVVEQSNGLNYRARDSYANNWTANLYYKASVSYITGAHAFKVGFNDGIGTTTRRPYDNQPVSFRLNNGVPNQLTMRAQPYATTTDVDHDLGLYAQDKWTTHRLTMTLGVRYDYFANSFPDQHLGSTLLTPGRELTLAAQKNLSLHDVTPKLGASYDLFGNGRTALKVTLNEYLQALGTSGLGGNPNPVNTLVLQTTRSWVDANRDYVPDCNLLNTAANGECGAMANSNFGKAVRGATYDPDVLTGWRHRNFNWEFSAGVQHELIPRLSVDLGYFRRWYGNFDVTDNRTVAPSDFDPFSITAPTDPRLPNGGGYVVSGLYDLKPARFGLPADNLVTLASKYGKQIEHWNGVDLSANARLQNGLLLQGGLSTGRTVTDKCDVVTKLDNPSLLYCHVETPFLTQLKGFGAYTISKIDVLLSAAFQSLPGPQIAANFNAPNALAAASLGRSLSGGAANVTVNLVEPGSMYGERLNQLDLRVAKLFRFGGRRATVNLDLYNALNSSAVLAENSNFAAWRRPTSILTARFAKLSAQFDF